MSASFDNKHNLQGDAAMQQALSAWMDGESLPSGVDADSLLQWAALQQKGRHAWQDWHLAGDVLREAPAFDAQPFQQPQGVGSAGWHVRLQQTLASTRVASEEQDIFGEPATLPAPHVPVKVASGAREAANAPVWRWKMAAGFASVAAIGMLAWNMLGLQPGAAPATAPVEQMALVGTTPPKSEMQSAAVEASGNDPYLHDMLLAHAQLGGQSLLPDLTTASDVE